MTDLLSRDARGVHLPLAPLEQLLCSRLDARRVMTADDDHYDPTLARPSVMAAMCGVTYRTWRRWQLSGIPRSAADGAAVAIGEHPLLIWPDFHSR